MSELDTETPFAQLYQITGKIDLRRIAGECGLDAVEVAYSRRGRLPLTPWHYPAPLAATAPRWMSDNLAVIGRRCVSRS